MKLFLSLFFVIVSFQLFSQVKKFDKLEMYYDQGHYALVLKKANKLLDDPTYDYSLVPSLYKSMALFQMSQNEYWFKRNPNSLEEAKDLFTKIKSSSDGIRIFEAHIFEISALKRDLTSWTEDLKRLNQRQAFENVQEIMYNLFENVPDIEFEGGKKVEEISTESNDISEGIGTKKQREQIVENAKKQLGVPYSWAGNTPKGFDCSGFTSYVLKDIKKDLPRRAVEQYENATKVKKGNAQMGDLIFFDNGAGISHVGIVVSNKNEPLTMIHSSSSKGVIITEIEKSAYWEKRVFGFGTFVTE
ncbi:MAG: C40 family peptidase [Bacteroidota bacterium]